MNKDTMPYCFNNKDKMNYEVCDNCGFYKCKNLTYGKKEDYVDKLIKNLTMNNKNNGNEDNIIDKIYNIVNKNGVYVNEK